MTEPTIEEWEKQNEKIKELEGKFTQTGAIYDIVTLSAAEMDLIRKSLAVYKAAVGPVLKSSRAAEDNELAYTE